MSHWPQMRYATLDDIDTCQRISRSKWLPFVRRDSLAEAVYRHELLVVEVNEAIAGFCRYHVRQDGWTTLHELAVLPEYQGRGIGRQLLYAVPCPIRLKCMTDNPANEFWHHAGMRRVGNEQGKTHTLNVYEMRVLSIIVRGNKADVVKVARETGNAYGIHHGSLAHAWPYMVDSDPEHCIWTDVMKVVRIYHPVQALTMDYYEGKREQMLEQVDDLRQEGVLRIAVCPKFHGAVADIPAHCIVAVSLKTNGKLAKGANKYAGFMPDFAELVGRKIHLLGGSPRLQKETIVKLQAIGAKVLSVDGNSQFGAAEKGSAWIDGRWKRQNGEAVDLYSTYVISSRNIQRELNAAAEWQQERLL